MAELTNIAYREKLHLLDNVMHIADRQYQEDVWVKNNRQGVRNSWEETMCMIFDDIDLEWMFDPENRELHGYTVEQFDALIKFLNTLESYVDENIGYDYIDPEELKEDEDWQLIVDEAQAVIKLFPEVKDLDRLLEEAILIPEDD